jgi:CARDB/Divergent InlB B-repeat domain
MKSINSVGTHDDRPIRGRRHSSPVILLAITSLTLLGLVVPPASASPRKAISLSGVYTEVHGDSRYADETLYLLDTPGHYYQLKTAGEPSIHSRAKVKVHGTISGNTIDVTTPGSIQVLSPAPVIAAIGTKSVLVINVTWPGTSLTATQAQENNFMFGNDPRSVASYYASASYGQMTWTGTETPNYSIPDPAACDLGGLAIHAEEMASAGGYTPAAYDAVVVNAPALYCGSAGYGEIGGKHVWIQDGLWNLDDGYARLVPTHELGHSLGLYHSHGLECGSTTVDVACLGNPGSHNEEYGNAWDVMGNNWPGDGNDSVTWFSAKQEILLGWLSGSRLKSVSGSGIYNLVPLEQAGTTSPQALVIQTPANTYYVEYRQPIGQDAFMSGYPAATNGVHINVSASFGGDTGPFALDFTPQSDTTSSYSDWFDAPLATGKSFTDPSNTFTISPLSQNGTNVAVQVSFATPSTYPLTVPKSGNGSGAITSTPSGISCGTSCSAAFPSGASVTLVATPGSGSTFSGWSGACAGITTSCTVSVSSALSVGASFAIAGSPDLIVTSLTWSPSSPVPGSAVLFKATIKNQGSTATPAGVIHGLAFLVDATKVAFSDSDTASLAAGASVTLTANGSNAGPATWPATRGRHTVKAWIDDLNRIAESNDSNNTLSKRLNVYATLAPSSVTISSGTARAGTAASLAKADGVTFQVNSTTSTTRTTRWSGTVVNVPNATAGLQVVYKGNDSVSSTQTIYLFNYTTNAWVGMKTSTVGTTAVTLIIVPTGTMADYVSGATGSGSVKVQLKTTNTTASFHTSADQLNIGYL